MAYIDIDSGKKLLPPKEMLPGIYAFPPNPDSFGGISYLIACGECLFMVDVPEYAETNVNFIKSKGSPDFIFLTHRDDVADAVLFRREFGSRLIIHKSERNAVESPNATFGESLKIGEVTILHTPGHSPGSSCLFYPASSLMFTGDHVTPEDGRPVAENFSWTYDYELQLRSVNALLVYDFKYILAGHGGRRLMRDARNQLRKFLEENCRKSFQSI